MAWFAFRRHAAAWPPPNSAPPRQHAPAPVRERLWPRRGRAWQGQWACDELCGDAGRAGRARSGARCGGRRSPPAAHTPPGAGGRQTVAPVAAARRRPRVPPSRARPGPRASSRRRPPRRRPPNWGALQAAACLPNAALRTLLPGPTWPGPGGPGGRGETGGQDRAQRGRLSDRRRVARRAHAGVRDSAAGRAIQTGTLARGMAAAGRWGRPTAAAG